MLQMVFKANFYEMNIQILKVITNSIFKSQLNQYQTKIYSSIY